MTADEVLEEFLLDPCCIDCPASDCINERRMAEEIVRLRHALQEAHRPPEDAEHHPYHWGEMADMAIDAAVRIAQSDTSRCLSCGAWV